MIENHSCGGATGRSRCGASLVITATVAFVSLLFGASQTMGQLVPPGLNAGDNYHLIFISSTTRDGTSGNIADYDAVVQAAADSAGIGISAGRSWAAMASTGAVNARDHAVISAPVYTLRLLGMGGPELIATDAADMWDGVISGEIRFDESGVDLGTTDAWTGSLADGTRDPANDYLGSTTNNAWCGRSTQTSDSQDWFHFLKPAKTIQLHVYGLSEMLTAPEPSSATSGVLGLLGLLVFWRHPGRVVHGI